VPRFALSTGSPSVLQPNLVAVGPTIIIILGFVKWAATIDLFIVSRAALAPIPTDYRRRAMLGLSWQKGNVSTMNQSAEFLSLSLGDSSQFSKAFGECRNGCPIGTCSCGEVHQSRGRVWVCVLHVIGLSIVP
jgi:hypothetical protein